MVVTHWAEAEEAAGKKPSPWKEAAEKSAHYTEAAEEVSNIRFLQGLW